METNKIRLGEIATYVNGYAFKPKDRGNVGLPIVRIQDLTGNARDVGFYNGEYPKKIEINNGDILISWSASLGVYVWNKGKALLNQHIFRVVFDKGEIDKSFFVYAVRQKLKEMGTKTHGATMKHIVKKDFDAIEIPYPQINRQIEIARNMDKISSVIEKKERQLKLLDDLIQSRFVEMFGSVHDGRFEMKTLPEIVMKERNAIKRGPFGGSLKKQDFVEKGYLVYEQKHAIHEDFEYEKYYITKKKYEDMIAFKVIPGDLIVSCSGTLGRIAEVPNNAPEGIINQALLKLSLDQTIMKNKFFVYQFRNKEIQDILFGFSRGSGIPNMPSMNEIKKVKFLCPPIDLQNQFAIVVEQVNKSKFVIHKFLYCTTHNTQSIIKPRPNTKESGKTRGGKPYADEF